MSLPYLEMKEVFIHSVAFIHIRSKIHAWRATMQADDDQQIVFFQSHKKKSPPFPTGHLIHEVMPLYLKSVIYLVIKEVWPPRHHSDRRG
jgi:hypothetical protein